MAAGNGLVAVSRPKLHRKDLDICCRLLRRCAVSLPLAVFNVALVGQFDQASVVQEAENRLKEESILKGDGDCLLLAISLRWLEPPGGTFSGWSCGRSGTVMVFVQRALPTTD
jgi:hypothetical protein